MGGPSMSQVLNNAGGQPAYTGANTGTPKMPSYLSTLGPDGKLLPQNTVNPGAGPTLNTDPLKQLEAYSSSGSNNPWVIAQQQALKQSQGQAMGAAKSNAMSANTAAADAAEAHGGLSTGARENLNASGANNATMAGNAVVGQGLQQEGAIQTQNAQNELGTLENLPGQEVQATQPALQEQQLNLGAGEFNAGNTIGGLNSQNQFNLSNYANQIAQQAGSEQATAAANSGKK